MLPPIGLCPRPTLTHGALASEDLDETYSCALFRETALR